MRNQFSPDRPRVLRFYLRRSREDHQHHSIDTQREGATRFAEGSLLALLGVEAVEWAERVVYRDDDSGGEFAGRDGYQRLLADAGPGDVIVCRDISRLGREMLETTVAIRTLIERGARLFFYADATECRARTPEQILMIVLSAFAPHKEREAIRSRTREALRSRILKGQVAGGLCFGYRNVRQGPDKSQMHTVREIDPGQANVVVSIFEDRARGLGYRAIAKQLNERGVSSPRAKKRGKGAWAPSAVRSIITRERYRGVIVHGRWVKVDIGGSRKRVRAPEEEVLKVPAEHLRIVSDELWWSVQPPKRAEKQVPADGLPRPRRSPNRRHPFSGVGRCGECGGPMMVANSKTGQAKRLAYCCGWHRDRGSAVCTNKLRRPKDIIEEKVADYLLREVLTERMVAEVIRRVRDRVATRRKVDGSKLNEIRTELHTLDGEIRHLVDAIAAAPELGTLLDGLRQRERRRNSLAQELEVMRRTPAAVDLELRRIEDEARERLVAVRDTFQDEQQAACQLVEALFPSGMTFTPIEVGGRPQYLIEGDAVVGPGILSEPTDDDVILRSVPSGI